MDLMNRLLSRTIKQPNGCWEWQRAKNKYGYGIINVGNGKDKLAHRLSYELFKGGNIPPKMHVCHSCDNRKCVNPDHLWLGTNKDNMEDKADKGRVKGSKNPYSKLTEQQVLEIRQLIGTMNQKQIGKIYNVTQTTISEIKNRKIWNHV